MIRGALLIGCASLLWATTSIVAKFLFSDSGLEPLTLALLRLLVALPVFWVLMRRELNRQRTDGQRRWWPATWTPLAHCVWRVSCWHCWRRPFWRQGRHPSLQLHRTIRSARVLSRAGSMFQLGRRKGWARSSVLPSPVRCLDSPARATKSGRCAGLRGEARAPAKRPACILATTAQDRKSLYAVSVSLEALPAGG